MCLDEIQLDPLIIVM